MTWSCVTNFKECDIEWYHLKCVGLQKVPSKNSGFVKNVCELLVFMCYNVSLFCYPYFLNIISINQSINQSVKQ